MYLGSLSLNPDPTLYDASANASRKSVHLIAHKYGHPSSAALEREYHFIVDTERGPRAA